MNLKYEKSKRNLVLKNQPRKKLLKNDFPTPKNPKNDKQIDPPPFKSQKASKKKPKKPIFRP
jgi:hypothetical protein